MTFPKIRVLPLTIAAAALMLTVQAGSLWDTVSLGLAGPARAEEAKEAKSADHAAAEETKDKGKKDGHGEATAHEPPAEDDEDKDLLSDFTPEEIEILYELAKRRETLNQREAELAAREALIGAAEQRMDARVAELRELRHSIEELVGKYNDQERKELKSVVKIYESMKPKDAAEILEKLDLPILLSIVDAMSERRSSAILAAMRPDRARELTAEMAREKAIDLSRVSADRNPG